MDLSEKRCIPCEGGVPPLDQNSKFELLKQLHKDWELINGDKKLKRIVSTKDFKEAFDLATPIAKESDEQWHHPDLTISFGRLVIIIWTHKIDDLVESDFIFASKVDKIVERKEK